MSFNVIIFYVSTQFEIILFLLCTPKLTGQMTSENVQFPASVLSSADARMVNKLMALMLRLTTADALKLHCEPVLVPVDVKLLVFNEFTYRFVCIVK